MKMGFGDKSKKEKQSEKNALNEAKANSAKEEAQWEETEKGAKKKLDRAAAANEKAEAERRKREEKKELEAAESEAVGKMQESAAAKKNKGKPTNKLTQAQIAQNLALLNAAEGQVKPKKSTKTQSVDQEEVTANLNRQSDVVAQTVEDALAALELDPKGEKKMTYKQFEQEMLERVKEDNPGLKANQVKEKVWKLWERSPLNPKNDK